MSNPASPMVDWSDWRPTIDALRREFPILDRKVHGDKPLIYLDNAATAQKPKAVLEVLNRFYTESNANVHRGIHCLAEEATEAYEASRKTVASWLGAPSEKAIVFTRGTTEAINLVAHGWGNKFLKPGDRILVTEMEHHSNLIPWQMLARRTGAVLDWIPVTGDGVLDLSRLDEQLASTRMVSLTHMSNVLGTVNPVRDVVARAHAHGALVLVDAAQSAPHSLVDLNELDCDFLAFSGHKLMGPTGVGVLYGRPELLEAMDPFLGGGEMISKVTWQDATWADIPYKFEAGTPPIAEVIGLGAAVRFLQSLDWKVFHAYSDALTRYAIAQLESIDGLVVHGKAPDRGGAISFSIRDLHPHDLAHFLDQDGLAIRAGHMCAQPLIHQLGHSALTRASLYLYNLPEEVDALVRGILRVKEFFHRVLG